MSPSMKELRDLERGEPWTNLLSTKFLASEVMPQQLMGLKALSASQGAVHYTAWRNSSEKKNSSVLCPPLYEKMPSACDKSVGAAA